MKIINEKSVGKGKLCLIKGDITKMDVDAIVNAANSYLQHGGGVAGAIVRNGGQIIQEESNRIGFVPVGKAAKTGAGNLPCKSVIHTVGPRMGEGDEDNKLISAVNSALRLAVDSSFNSISMPAISSGIFGFPKDRCAQILVSQSKQFLLDNQSNSLKTIEFCIIDDETISHFEKQFSLL